MNPQYRHSQRQGLLLRIGCGQSQQRLALGNSIQGLEGSTPWRDGMRKQRQVTQDRSQTALDEEQGNHQAPWGYGSLLPSSSFPENPLPSFLCST